MANSGIKASQAGTTMRSLMTSLAGEVKFSSKAFGELEVQTKKSDGSMRPLNDIVEECRGAFSQMTDAEKSANAEALVGKNAMSGFLALMNAAPKDITKVHNAISDADGAAASMAETMNDNLNGAVTILKSSLEGLGIELYEGMADPLKDAAKQATEYVGQLTDAFKNGGLDGLVAEAGNILGEVVTKAAQLAPKVAKAAVSLVQSFVGGISKNSSALTSGAANMITALLSGIMGMLPDILSCAAELLIGFASSMANQIPLLINNATAMIQTLTQGITDGMPEFLSTAVFIIQSLIQGLTDMLPQLVEAAGQLLQALATGIIDALPQLAEVAVQIIQSLVEGLMGALPALWKVRSRCWTLS